MTIQVPVLCNFRWPYEQLSHVLLAVRADPIPFRVAAPPTHFATQTSMIREHCLYLKVMIPFESMFFFFLWSSTFNNDIFHLKTTIYLKLRSYCCCDSSMLLLNVLQIRRPLKRLSKQSMQSSKSSIWFLLSFHIQMYRQNLIKEQTWEMRVKKEKNDLEE